MAAVNIPVHYYEQFGADYTRETPAEGFGGWKKTALPFDLARTAIVVMHAVDAGPQATFPGWYSACEYLPRANEIAGTILAPLLSVIRESPMTLYHIGMEQKHGLGHPGYQRAVELAGEHDDMDAIPVQPWIKALQQFKSDHVFPGKSNTEDVQNGLKSYNFYAAAMPLPQEGVVMNGKQLAALCKEDGIDHLIYIGFAINWCLLQSPGGMVEMSRRGLLCSTIREAVTAVERKDTARFELEKESALWHIAVAFGFVFDLADIVAAVKNQSLKGEIIE